MARNVSVSIIGHDRTAKAFDAAEKRATAYSNNTNKLSRSQLQVERSHARALKQMDAERAKADSDYAKRLTIIGGALATAGAAATSFATDLNTGMANVATLIPGQEERIKSLRGSVQELSKQYGTGTGGLTDALYDTISAFGDTNDTVKILEINTKAAKAGLASSAEALQLTSAVTKGYGDTSAYAVQKAADLAFKTVELGQTNFPQLAKSIGKVTPLAAALTVSQEELFGVMATATGVTGNAAEVSTQLRGVLGALLKPLPALNSLYDKMGVKSGKALVEQKGLRGALLSVVEAAEESGQPLGKYMESIEAQTLALALSGGQADEWVRKTAAMEDAAGAVDSAFAEQTEGVNKYAFVLDRLKARGEVAMQKLGQAIIDFGGPLSTGLLGVAQFGGAVSQMAPQITAFMATIGGWPGLATKVAVASRAMWAAITGPVGLAVGAVAAVGAGLYALWDYFDDTEERAKRVADSTRAYVEKQSELQRKVLARDSKAELEEGRERLRAIKEASEERIRLIAEEQEERAKKAAEFTKKWQDAGYTSGKAFTDAMAEEAAKTEKLRQAAKDAGFATIDAYTESLDAEKERVAKFWDDLSTGFEAKQKQAGELAAIDWTGGFHGAFGRPGGMMDTIPRDMMSLAEDGSFMLAGGKGGEEFTKGAADKVSDDNLWKGVGDTISGTLARAFEGGGDWLGAAKSIGVQVGDKIGKELSAKLAPMFSGMGGMLGGLLGKGLSMAIPMVGPLLSAGIDKLWKSLKKPSEAELAARRDVDDYEKAFVAGLSEAQIAEAMSAGWESWEDAAFLIGIRDQYLEIGKSAASAEQDVKKYWDAIEKGDMATIDAMQAQWDDMGVSIEDVAQAAERAWEKATGAAVSAFDRAKSEGIKAYDDVYQKAIETGLGEEAAADKAARARIEASDAVLAKEGENYARIAAFDAAMALGANATAEERKKAASDAAAAARDSWGAALDVVTAADKAATDAMGGHRDTLTTKIDIKAKEATSAVTRELDNQKSAVKDKLLDAQDAAAKQYEKLANVADQEHLAITSSMKREADAQKAAAKEKMLTERDALAKQYETLASEIDAAMVDATDATKRELDEQKTAAAEKMLTAQDALVRKYETLVTEIDSNLKDATKAVDREFDNQKASAKAKMLEDQDAAAKQYEALTKKIDDEAKAATLAEKRETEAQRKDVRDKVVDNSDSMVKSFEKLKTDARHHISGVTSAINNIPRTVDINYRGQRTGEHGGIGDGEFAAATGAYVYGGPRRIIVGEDGPEWILNTAQMAGLLNGGPGSGGASAQEIGEAIVAALRRDGAIQAEVPMGDVTLGVLRRTADVEALHGYGA